MQVSRIPTDETPPELAPLKIRLHEIIGEADVLLNQIALQDPRYRDLQRVSVHRLYTLTEPVRWGYECKTVRFYGRTYHFTDGQAELLRILKRCHDKGIKRVRERSLCVKLDIDDEGLKAATRLRARFITAGVKHPAYGVVVLSDDGWWWLGDSPPAAEGRIGLRVPKRRKTG